MSRQPKPSWRQSPRAFEIQVAGPDDHDAGLTRSQSSESWRPGSGGAGYGLAAAERPKIRTTKGAETQSSGWPFRSTENKRSSLSTSRRRGRLFRTGREENRTSWLEISGRGRSTRWHRLLGKTQSASADLRLRIFGQSSMGRTYPYSKRPACIYTCGPGHGASEHTWPATRPAHAARRCPRRHHRSGMNGLAIGRVGPVPVPKTGKYVHDISGCNTPSSVLSDVTASVPGIEQIRFFGKRS